jgi:hypothetical protein
LKSIILIHFFEVHDGRDIKRHGYYQWVGVVLFVQAVSFYVPRFIWTTVEEGRIGSLVQNLRNPLPDKESIL